jgi:hypothetical protein
VQIRFPEFLPCLELEPPETNKETVQHTSFVVITTGLLGSLDHLIGDDSTIRLGDGTLVDLERNDLFDLIFQTESNLGHFLSRTDGSSLLAPVSRKYYLPC